MAHFPLCTSFPRLVALAELVLRVRSISVHLNILLGFLEESRTSERATLRIDYVSAFPCSSQRRATTVNQFQCLSICPDQLGEARVFISNGGVHVWKPLMRSA